MRIRKKIIHNESSVDSPDLCAQILPKDLAIAQKSDILSAQFVSAMPLYEFFRLFLEQAESKTAVRLRSLLLSHFGVELPILTDSLIVKLHWIAQGIALRNNCDDYHGNALQTTPWEHSLLTYLRDNSEVVEGLSTYPRLESGTRKFEKGKFFIGPYSVDLLTYGGAIMDGSSPLGTVIELDGRAHDYGGKMAKDWNKEELLRRLGFVRFLSVPTAKTHRAV